MTDWPPAPPAPALSRSCLCIPRQPMGLVTGFGSRKEKINSLCPTRCCSFPTAVTILSLFPGKQMAEETTPFEVRSSLKKKSPESQGGHQAASSVAMEANQQDSPRPFCPLRRTLHQHIRVGHFCVQLKDGVSPRTALPLALRSGLDPKHTARCSQVGKVGK